MGRGFSVERAVADEDGLGGADAEVLDRQVEALARPVRGQALQGIAGMIDRQQVAGQAGLGQSILDQWLFGIADHHQLGRLSIAEPGEEFGNTLACAIGRTVQLDQGLEAIEQDQPGPGSDGGTGTELWHGAWMIARRATAQGRDDSAGERPAAAYKRAIMLRRLVPLLLAFGGALPLWSAAVDPLVTTTWEVRRNAEELLADLRTKREQPANLIERAQTMLHEHGASLVANGTAFAPLSEVVAEALAKAGLAEGFVRTYGPLAERRLAELLAGHASDEALRRLALAFPGTASARQAWIRLADRAWDHGRLAAYLASAVHAGEPTDATRTARFAAGLDLLAQRAPILLPASLELEEMWNLPVELPEVRPAGQRPGPRASVPRGFVISPAMADLTAASDGQTLFVFDHLVGRRVGSLHQIGVSQLPARVRMPAVTADGFVALGGQHGGVALTAVGRDGEVRWSVDAAAGGMVSAFSGPLVVDGLVVFAVLSSQNDEGPELRLVARHLSDGSPAWDAFIVKLPLLLHRGMIWDGSDNSGNPPALCLHAGRVLLLSNSGIVARVTSQGAVERIWTYPSLITSERIDGGREPLRSGGLHSDGLWALATPADANGFSLVMGPQDDELRRYTGDGCRGEVLDVVAGVAVLAGGKQITCLDLAELKPRWQRQGPVSDPSGVIGEGRVLVGSRERLSLLDLGSGNLLAERNASPPLSIACNDGLLLVGGNESVKAFGKAEVFIAEQLAASARNPADYRPLVALGKLWSAQGDAAKAYDFFLQGLARGAPAEYASAAARLVRSQLDRDLDQPQAFAAGLARLDQLAPYDHQLTAEGQFWRARRAEVTKDSKAAIAAYRELLASAPLRVTFGVKRDELIDVQLQALAQLGLARLAAAPLPGWAQAIGETPVAPAAKAWSRPSSRQTTVLCAGTTLLGYEGGALTARSLADGKELWRRTPDQRLLGVKHTGQPPEAKGVLIEVLDGTAAAAAGLKTGDLLITFNGRAINDFQNDLIPAVADAQEGAPFTVTVLRQQQSLELTGRLGGELVEALTANATTTLVWPVFPVRKAKGQGEGLWLAAHDLATGRELWRGAIPPATVERRPLRPILTDDDTVICADGSDLIGLALRATPEPRERWRLAGLAHWLENALPLSAGALLLAEAAHGQARVIDVSSGETLFLLPCDAEAGGILERTDLVVNSPDGRLACWDLAQGRLRWRSDKPMSRPLAVNGDNVYALTDRKQLVVLDRANGQQRRLYGDWAALDETATAGGRLFANVRRRETGRALISVALAGGTVLWERPLPRGSEVRSFHVTAAGVACVLAEPTQKPTILGLGVDGAVSAALTLPEDQTIRPLSGGVLVSGTKGLEVLVASTVAPPPPLPIATATAKESLIATAQAVVPNLNWQAVGPAAYAVARLDRSLLLFARLPPEVETLDLRVGDAGPEIDVFSQSITFQRHRVARFNSATEGWRAAGTQKLPAENNVWLSVMRIDPPVGRTPGTGVQVRASTAQHSDGPEAPWWLRRAWRTLADPTSGIALPAPMPTP